MGIVQISIIIALIVTPIIAFKKKHDYKIPIIIIHIVAILLFGITGSLTDKGEIGRDSQVLLFLVSGLMFLGALIWCFITPKNKE